MTIVDWRQVDARGLALVYARERARWLIELGWETRESWLQVERARTTWGLPGLAAVDDGGRVRGLTFFHSTGGRFDVGGVFAETDAVREALIDGAVSVCEDAGGEEVSAFLYTAAPQTAQLFASRGFALDKVDYLSLTLDRATFSEPGQNRQGFESRDWTAGDVDVLAALLHASYETTTARRYVQEPSEHGWRQYLSSLMQHHACGVVLPSATRLALNGHDVVGAVLVTDLGPATAHIAQVAVHPAWRNHGLSGTLIDDAARRVKAAGYARMTLLASATNPVAQRLYRRRGYVESARFLLATKPLTAMQAAQAS